MEATDGGPRQHRQAVRPRGPGEPRWIRGHEDAAGAAEHQERPQGRSGARHTIGELLTCPFCLAVWLGTAYVGGLATAPRVTRAVAAVASVVAIADWLHLGHEVLRKGALADD